MICVSVRERRCVIRIYIFLMAKMFYSFERCFTLFDLPLYSFTSVGVNRSAYSEGKDCRYFQVIFNRFIGEEVGGLISDSLRSICKS